MAGALADKSGRPGVLGLIVFNKIYPWTRSNPQFEAGTIMLIIDTHTHVFPTVRERLQEQLPHSVFKSFDEWMQKTKVPPSFASLRNHWIKWVETLESRGLDIEGIASLQAKIHPQMYRVLEGLMTTVLGPKLTIQGHVQNLLNSMKNNGIQKSVVIASGTNSPNDWVLDLALENPELIPVADLPILPLDSNAESYFNEVERLIARGAKGLQIHSNLDNLPADHIAYHVFFELAAKYELFIILHSGHFHVPIYKNNLAPKLSSYEAYFQKYPNVKVCLAHMGRESPEEVWQMMKSYEQIYTDTSWQPASNIRQAVSAIGHDRILLGSDWPLLHMNLQGDALNILLSAVNEKKAADICGRKALSFLG